MNKKSKKSKRTWIAIDTAKVPISSQIEKL